MIHKENITHQRPELSLTKKIKYGCLVYFVCGLGSAFSGLIFISEHLKKIKRKGN